MKKLWKKMLAGAVTAGLLLGLTACSDKFAVDVTAYVQGELDCVYKGIVDEEYIGLVDDLTEEKALQKHEDNVTWEAEILLDFLAVELPTEAVIERAEALVTEIYSNARYQVAEAERLKSGDMAVEVTVSPIEILPLLADEFVEDAWYGLLEAEGVDTQETLDARYEELDEKYAMILLDELERLMPELSYGEDQHVMLQLKEDTDGYYSLVDTGWQKLDEIMIDYLGDYAE